jgi:hypothetical protein
MKTVLSFSLMLFVNLSFGQWNTDLLTTPRSYVGSGIYNGELFFVGGGSGTNETTVDIYDLNLQTLVGTTNISLARGYSAVVGGDSALYVAGGYVAFGDPITGSNVVDIYKNGVWTTHILPEDINIGNAVHVGTKVMFTGGMTNFTWDGGGFAVPTFSDSIYVYDELTDVWSTMQLSVPRTDIGVATDGTIAIFAGGWTGSSSLTDVVDIYDSNTDTWSTATLSEARGFIGATYTNGKFIFAGGTTATGSSNTVDIFDGSTWTTDVTSSPRAGMVGVSVGELAIFAGGGVVNPSTYYWQSATNEVDVYNTTSGVWTTNNLNVSRSNATAQSGMGVAYVGGGFTGASAANSSSIVEVWDVLANLNESSSLEISISPNPASSEITLNGLDINTVSDIQITRIDGSIIESITPVSTNIDVSELIQGVYFIQIISDTEIIRSKFIKQ